MSGLHAKFEFEKTCWTDPVLIDDLNDNMDILDQEVQDIREILDNLFVEEGELLDE